MYQKAEAEDNKLDQPYTQGFITRTTSTLEHGRMPTSIKERDMERVYALCYDPVMITGHIKLQRVARTLVDKGSGSCLWFSNCSEKMGLP